MKLPEILRGEAANTAVYVMNKATNKASSGMTPYERYFARKPKVSHLRVFGSLIFIKLQERKRKRYQKKLDPRAKKGVLIGYAHNNTYLVYDAVEKKVIVSHHVAVDETRTYDWENATGRYDNLDVLIDTTRPDIQPDENACAENGPASNNEGEAAPIERVEPDDDDQFKSFEESFGQRGELGTIDDTSVVDEETAPPVPPRASSKPQEAPRTYMTRSKTKQLATITEESGQSTSNFAEVLISEAKVSVFDELSNYGDAMSSEDKSEWRKAMTEEINALKK